MRRIQLTLILLATLLTTLTASAIHSDTTQYAYPMLRIDRYYAANFGEIRPGHFHAGIDIKTGNAEGKPIVAIGDGYLSRATISTYGYGKGLYLKLATGETAVYGHLRGFRKDVADSIARVRYSQHKNHVDLEFAPNTYPVKRGDVIAYSGNTGSSMGPHLHFEIRTQGEGKLLNLVKEGVIGPRDDIRPRIVRLHYVEIDSLDGICVRKERASYAVKHLDGGRYSLLRDTPIEVGRKGYFIAEVTDRRNDVHNTFGMWRVTAMMDSHPYFEYQMNGFTLDYSRYSDAVSCYTMQVRSRNEVIRLAQLETAPAFFYPVMVDRGVVRTEEGEHHSMRLEIEDDSRNKAFMDFEIVGRKGEFHAERPADSRALAIDRPNTLNALNQFEIHLPKDALFESRYAHVEQTKVSRRQNGVVVLSDAVRIFDEVMPLRRSASIRMWTEVPHELKSKTLMARYSPRKGLSAVGGYYLMGEVTARSRTLDWFVVVADTLAPRIHPRFTEGANLRDHRDLRFTISDNFSGINTTDLYIDGEWVPTDRLPYKAILYHEFDRPATGKMHDVRLIVTDGVGNTTEWRGRFRR